MRSKSIFLETKFTGAMKRILKIVGVILFIGAYQDGTVFSRIFE